MSTRHATTAPTTLVALQCCGTVLFWGLQKTVSSYQRRTRTRGTSRRRPSPGRSDSVSEAPWQPGLAAVTACPSGSALPCPGPGRPTRPDIYAHVPGPLPEPGPAGDLRSQLLRQSDRDLGVVPCPATDGRALAAPGGCFEALAVPSRPGRQPAGECARRPPRHRILRRPAEGRAFKVSPRKGDGQSSHATGSLGTGAVHSSARY
jgi:hypothetical protein